mmetsp:Transcript_26538/g.61955  ORF Transcript_26538/g.61955 Transcript_26538/m.61955 type:complete len:256 (-) Transcript_26538:45-812(-)
MATAGSDAAAKLGFTRAEMNSQKPLAGTWKDKTDRMLFLVLGRAEDWPGEIKDLPKDSLYHKLQTAVADAKLEGGNRIFLAEAAEGDSEGDVFVFPGNARFNIAKDGTAPLVSALRSSTLSADLEDLNVFICAHTKRDERCGYCGPALLDAMKQQQIAGRVRKCSHVGGHIYAGNVVVFPDASRGDFYGYVTPGNVRSVVSGWARKSELWRGGLGLTPDMAKAARKHHVLMTQVVPAVCIAGAAAAGAVWYWKKK